MQLSARGSVELQRISIPRIVLKRLFLCRFVAFNFRDEVDIGRQHILTVRLLNSADLISSTQINDTRVRHVWGRCGRRGTVVGDCASRDVVMIGCLVCGVVMLSVVSCPVLRRLFY